MQVGSPTSARFCGCGQNGCNPHLPKSGRCGSTQPAIILPPWGACSGWKGNSRPPPPTVNARSMAPRLVAIAGPFEGRDVSRCPAGSPSAAIPPTSSPLPTTRSRAGIACWRKPPMASWCATLGSRAGTVVNGAVTSNVLLQHGDRIAVGDSAFLYLAEAGQPALRSSELYDQALADESTVQLPPRRPAAIPRNCSLARVGPPGP